MQTDYDYVMERLAQKKGQWPSIAEASGVPKDTLVKVAQGKTDPRASTVDRLVRYFRGIEVPADVPAGAGEQQPAAGGDQPAPPRGQAVAEPR